MAKLRGILDTSASGGTPPQGADPRLPHPEDANMTAEAHAAAIQSPDPLASWSLALIGAGLILFLVAAAVFPVDEMIWAEGRVSLSGHAQFVAPRHGGIVENILVREGDEVEAGQVLIRIENRDARAALDDTRARIAALAVRALRLEAEASGRDAVAFPRDVEAATPEDVSRERWLFGMRRESLLSELEGLEQRRRRQEQNLSSQEAVIASLEKKLDMLHVQLGARHDAAEHRPEIAQADPAPIEVPHPGPNQTVSITVVAGRPLKLAFGVDDVKSRDIVNDDLVLEFDNGGRVVLKEYMTAFGKLGEVRTTIIVPDGQHYAFTELLAASAGRHGNRPVPGTRNDAVIIQRPPAREKRTYKLTEEKPTALNFGFREIAKSQVDTNGDLVLIFKNGAILVLERYAELRDKGVYFAKGDKIALSVLARAAGPKDAGARIGKPNDADRGTVEHLEALRLQHEIEDAEGELAAERLKIPRIRAAIVEVRQKRTDRMNAFVAEARKDLSDTEGEIARLKEKLKKFTFDVKTNEVKAPLRGIVKQLRVATKGGIVKPGEPLVEITPLDDTLVIEGRVRPNDIAFVRIGQHALVKITAYNYATYGGLVGNVVEISPDAIEAPEKPGETYFRVKIRTTRSFLEPDGKKLPIGPGMTAQASIKIGSKTLLAYILKPLTKATRHIKIDEPLPGDGSRPPEPGRPSAESL